MIIKQIELENIGPYLGKGNILDLSSTNKKNIILIGGKNGAGKTTLLNSIKIGLFGSFAFGLKTESDTYYKQLYNLLNYQKLSDDSAYFSIKILFEIVESFKKNNYTIVRSWNKDGFSINENIEIFKSSKLLNKLDQEIILDKLKEIMPPYLIDTMLFDGEKIANIISENKTPEYIKQLVDINFNLNVFDKLSDDMSYYIASESSNKGLSTEEINLIEYQNNYKEHDRNIKNYKKIKDKNEILLQELEFENKRLLDVFYNYDGITEEKKKILEEKLSNLERENRDNKTYIKNIFEEDYPLLINKKLIKKLLISISESKPDLYLSYIEQIKKYIDLPELNKVKLELESRVYSNSSKILVTADIEEKILSLKSKILNMDTENLYNLYIQTKDSSTDYHNVKNMIELNEKSQYNVLSEMLEAIQKIQYEIDEVKKNIADNNENIQKEQDLYEIALSQYEDQELKIDNNRKELSSFNIASKIRKFVDEYKKIQLKEYLDKISKLTIKKFEEVNKKEHYLSDMYIDDKTFEITLKDNNNINKNQTILSAGERQLLISSIIWSIFKLSGRNNIFIFDTPLARLDKENRRLFAKHILSTISSQVLLLSTDQEIIGKVYSEIKNLINKSYLIENDSLKGQTYIKEGYFMGVKDER